MNELKGGVMNIGISESGKLIEVTEIYNPIELRIDSENRLLICERDGMYELTGTAKIRDIRSNKNFILVNQKELAEWRNKRMAVGKSFEYIKSTINGVKINIAIRCKDEVFPFEWEIQ